MKQEAGTPAHAARWAQASRLVIGLGLAGLILGGDAAGASELRVEGRALVDTQGRVVILRGINVAGNSKVPPFLGITDITQLDPLPVWGFNAVRLVFSWEAYEPIVGRYNNWYLGYITNIVEAAWARGLYVIIDFHNDGFSRYLANGCGEGFPRWAVSRRAVPDTPDNGPNCHFWLNELFSDPDTFISFRDFFSDRFGVRSRYLVALTRVASHLANRPGVIGYDVFTEPPGDEPLEIAPLYEDAAAAVRSVDPDAILFLEPRFSVAGGTTQTLLPRLSFDNYVYAPHYYDSSVLWEGHWTGDATLTNSAFANMAAKSDEWNVPVFVGEFGGPAPAIGIGPYMDLLHRKLNQLMFSGAQWNYTPGWDPVNLDGWNVEDLSIVDDAGQLRASFKLRPYPQKVSGIPLQIQVSDDATRLEVQWNHAPATGVTEIFLPKAELFPQTGAFVELTGNGLVCGYGPREKVLFCGSTTAGVMQIVVRACQPGAEVCF